MIALTKNSETATTITLGWSPVPGCTGYRFSAEKQAKPSHTWDPARSSARFSNGSAWYKVEALGVADSGVYPSAAPPPTGITFTSPTARVTLDAGEIAAWSVYDSPNRQTLGAERDKHSIIRWDAQGYYSARKTYTLFAFKVLEGFPGRFYDFHTSPAGVGGWSPPGSNAVASLALDWRNDGNGIQVVNQPDWPNHEHTIIPAAEAKRNEWIYLWAEIVWGRPGSIKIWKAGEDAPRIDRSATTYWPDQNLVTLWEGAYESTQADERCQIEIAATHLGRTPEECSKDTPVLFVIEGAGSPAGSGTPVASLMAQVPMPASLRW